MIDSMADNSSSTTSEAQGPPLRVLVVDNEKAHASVMLETLERVLKRRRFVRKRDGNLAERRHVEYNMSRDLLSAVRGKNQKRICDSHSSREHPFRPLSR